MNCTDFVGRQFRSRAGHTALWTASGRRHSFVTMGELAAGAQGMIHSEGIGPGDAVLVLGPPGPLLFSAVIGLLASGITVVFVEPWLPIAEIDGVVRRVAPRAFLGSRLARLWALRVRAVRAIPRWLPLSRLRRSAGSRSFHQEELDPDTPGTVTFSSGTTGRPRGLVRSHGCLRTLFRLLADDEPAGAAEGPDLCVFPNLALLHLGTGRGSVLFPRRWSARAFRRLASVARAASPTTVSCGPGFLQRLLHHVERRPDDFTTLRQVAVGGAQVDCGLLERGFHRWPDARWLQVYGGSEAEPVAIVNARRSVDRSRDRGLFQALFLGTPIDEIDTEIGADGLWVSGPNVATPYDPGRDPESRRIDPDGREWHHMGDRIDADALGWWYGGRATQPRAEFQLEQRLYSELGTSACFVHRDAVGRLLLFGEDLPAEARDFGADFRSRHPELDGCRPLRIVRDRRHRARIDRRASLARGGYARD